jgi:predicted phage gp36 major capsid-like protein
LRSPAIDVQATLDAAAQPAFDDRPPRREIRQHMLPGLQAVRDRRRLGRLVAGVTSAAGFSVPSGVSAAIVRVRGPVLTQVAAWLARVH